MMSKLLAEDPSCIDDALYMSSTSGCEDEEFVPLSIHRSALEAHRKERDSLLQRISELRDEVTALRLELGHPMCNDDDGNDGDDGVERDGRFKLLPPELLSLVFDFLPSWFVPVVGYTCRGWREAQLYHRHKGGEINGARSTRKQRAKRLCIHAASSGWIGILRWGLQQGFPWNAAICSSAAASGHLHVLIWARSHFCPWNERTCEEAARNGHLDVLAWARSRGCCWNNKTALAAVRGGHIDVLRYAWEHGLHRPSSGRIALHKAASLGHVEMVCWLLEDVGVPWRPNIAGVAAREGHLELLRCVAQRHRGQLGGPEVVLAGLRGGHMDVVRWGAATCGMPRCSDKVTSHAAASGVLEALMWARENGHPWPSSQALCTVAARDGHLEVLQWAVMNGARWSPAACYSQAKRKKNEEMMRWIKLKEET